MASDSEIIRAFLVSVGVQVDEKGLKRFDEHVGKITETVTTLAKAAAAAAVAVSAAVVKVSAEFEDLFYASQRLKSSVDNIKAFGFGVSQMGGDAKSARASLEAFASFMRSNPMGEGVVRGLGVETRDAAGNAREYADVLRDVGAQLRKMPYWAAKQRANLLGIDENTLQALLRGTDLWSDRYRKMVAQSGVDMDKMAADMTSLIQSFRLIRSEIEIYFYKALTKVNPELLKLAGIVAAVGGALAVVAALLGPEVALVIALAAAIAYLANDFDNWKKGAGEFDWGEWADDIDRVVASLGFLWEALKNAGKAAWAFHDVLTDDQWDKFGHGLIRTLGDLITMFGDLVNIASDFANMDFGKMRRDFGKLVKDGMDHPFADHSKDGPGPSRQARTAALARPPAAANANTPAERNSQADAMAYFMRQGWTREQAAGIVANLNRESGMSAHGKPGDSGLAKGVAQWHPDRQADFAAWAGHGLDQSTYLEQLAFVNYELTRGKRAAAGNALKRQTTAAGAGGVVSRLYEGPKAADSEAAARGKDAVALMGSLGADGGSRTVTIHAKTDVKVTGAADAKETGKAVGDAVDRRNSDLVRQTQAAVR